MTNGKEQVAGWKGSLDRGPVVLQMEGTQIRSWAMPCAPTAVKDWRVFEIDYSLAFPLPPLHPSLSYRRHLPHLVMKGPRDLSGT